MLEMNNMRFLTVLTTLLCVLCVAQTVTEDNTNTVRLCGRAFLRAVVYTCGGSRWRRLMGEEVTLEGSEYAATKANSSILVASTQVSVQG